VEALISLIDISRHLVVLTGAGCSTESGIPDYRDAEGEWKHSRPIQYPDFVRSHATRQRYWARSMIGWQRVADARPNRAHVALARLEHAGKIRHLITQNIDGLHQLAGSRNVIDLHGRLANVLCLACGRRQTRKALQRELLSLNPDWQRFNVVAAPDGDARLETDFRSFRVPDCGRCGGFLKPDVVFFGENVPSERVAESLHELAAADTLLVAGSSLMVWSGLRYVRAASKRGIPTALINLGRTRADELFTHRVNLNCGDTLHQISERVLQPA
ncbi:MAG: NAD-dependent protein deacetylase, partial [Gammaproteobacteria bacterium]|nr:NAD-dependent protein deacetylase [Gammaproteobacteria bacterium]